MKSVSIGILTCLMFVFGCATRRDASVNLSKAELSVLENYHASPAMLEQAVRICFAHRFTKTEVVRFMGKTMRTEVGDRKVEYFWMPSQILTFNFDERSVIVNADLGFKRITQDDIE
jgi:hypothetical protein